MSVRIVHVTAAEVGPYQDSLRRLEHDITYPIADGADRFRIDHGTHYEAFFQRMGDAHFLLALDGDEVVGTLAGIARWAEGRGRRVRAIYGADWKIARAWRGGRLSRRYLWNAFLQAWRPATPRWAVIYVAAMRGERGDVMRSVRGFSPGRLGRPAARLAVFFTPRERLRALDPQGCPAVPPGGLDLSPDAVHEPPGVTSTAGCKDLWLESTGRPWPLWHLPLGPRAWTPSLAAYLCRAAEALPEGATACFAVDRRLEDLLGWLQARGLEPGATATVYALRIPCRAPPASPWVHLATSEI